MSTRIPKFEKKNNIFVLLKNRITFATDFNNGVP